MQERPSHYTAELAMLQDMMQMLHGMTHMLQK